MRVAGLLALGLAGCMAAPPPPASHEAKSAIVPAEAPRIFEWPVRLEAGAHGLGAYTLVLRFTASVARIEEIRGPGSGGFRGIPEFDPGTFATGVTRVAALDALGAPAQEGSRTLFTVVFRRVGAGLFRASAEVEKLYDEENRRFEGKLVEPRMERSFPRAD